MNQILIKSTNTRKIHMKQNINFYMKNVKMLEPSILVIVKLLLNTRMIWMIYKNIEEYKRNKKRKILIDFC